MTARRLAAPLAAAVATVGLAGILQYLTPGPPPLAYDPEAWLVWGRELAHGQLDVTVGPAIKPLPILVDAVAVPALGAPGARSAWALVAMTGLLAAIVLAWSLARAAAGRRVAAVGVGLLLLCPTLVEGGLTGAAEPWVLAGLLAASLALTAGRAETAGLVLAFVALLRPEALVLLAALTVWRGARASGVGERLRVVAVGSAGSLVVVAVWVALQLHGGAGLGGGVEAATALRSGQPGTAARPLFATSWTALTMLLPAFFVAAVLRFGVCRGLRDAGPQGSVACWLVAGGALWILTVAVMSEAGFSGEPRYLAPGAAVASLGVLLLASEGRRADVSEARPTSWPVAIAATTVITAAALVVAGEWRDARSLARSQADLTALLAQPSVRASAGGCDIVAVPQFLRPPTAWRLEMAMSSIQAPSPVGADCRLQRTSEATLPPGWSVVGVAGAWQWWQVAR